MAAASSEPAPRVLVAGVGYQNLRDLSVGPALVPILRDLPWAVPVEVDDLSFGPIAVTQRFQDRPGAYDQLVLVGATVRERPPGTVTIYRWRGEPRSPGEVQERVNEAVTGVISLDNLLIIADYFRALPPSVIVVEIEPEETSWGEEFSPRVEAALPRALRAVRRAALEGWHE